VMPWHFSKCSASDWQQWHATALLLRQTGGGGGGREGPTAGVFGSLERANRSNANNGKDSP
jgi:hypothetical protein